MFNFLGILS
jgi:poly [ADP-ribose] polymerase